MNLNVKAAQRMASFAYLGGSTIVDQRFSPLEFRNGEHAAFRKEVSSR